MQIQELLESIALKQGNILDLTRNYPQYSRLLARIENIRSSGKVDLLIVKAVSTHKKPPFVEGQTITVAQNYIQRAPIVAENQHISQYHADTKTYRKDGVNHILQKPNPNDIMNRGTPVDKYTNQDALEFDPTVDPIGDTEQRIDQERLRKLIKTQLQNLDPVGKALLKLRFWDELSHEEIAARMGIDDVNDVRDLERAALRKLKHPTVSKTMHPYL